jgi:hypothetical protein
MIFCHCDFEKLSVFRKVADSRCSVKVISDNSRSVFAKFNLGKSNECWRPFMRDACFHTWMLE